MRTTGTLAAGVIGLGLGVIGTLVYLGQPRPVGAASNDRFQDYVMATGAVTVKPGVQTDGVWMLDYRSGKLLGSVIDKNTGKIGGWAEVDLSAQFEVKPLQDVHFMMTTGYVTQGQSALYVAETTTGKFAVFTMGPGQGGGVVIRQHDMTVFRQAPPPTAPSLPATPIPGTIPPAAGPGVPVPPVAGASGMK